MEPKVVIEQRLLRGSDSYFLQLVATIYVGTVEYRVYAPPRAIGDSLEWVDQFIVHRPAGLDESDVLGDERISAIEMVRRALEATKSHPAEAREIMSEPTSIDKRRVFVVYGRNSKANDAIFAFLRTLDLAPMEWGEVIAATGQPSPFIGDALEKGFSIAQAAIVLLTGDDLARVGKRYLKSSDTADERVLTPQPWPNVLFEAGMAMVNIRGALSL